MKLNQFKMVRLAAGSALAAFAFSAAPVGAAEPGTYIGFQGGVNGLNNWGATVSLGRGINVPGNLSLDSGGHLGIFAGRQTQNARYEVEYQAGNFDITDIRLGPVRQAVSSSGRYKALTFNAYRTHELTESVAVFAGLGIGWGSASLPQLGFTGGCNCFAAASESGFSYLGRIGLEYRLQERHHAFVQFTSLHLPKLSSGASPGASYARKSVGIGAVGYRFLF